MSREPNHNPQVSGPVLAPHIEWVPRACPLCGSDDDRHVFADADFDPARLDGFAFASRKLPEYMHHRLISCPGCDLLYANPVPTLGTIARAYPKLSPVPVGLKRRVVPAIKGGGIGRLSTPMPIGNLACIGYK
jgi:hypothetical protein